MDRVLLDRLSWALILLAGVLIVGTILFAIRNLDSFRSSWIYLVPALAGGVVGYVGLSLHYYLQSGNIRQAVTNTLAGIAFVLAVIVAGLLLRQ